mgnify:CR=1 FL=1
MTMEMKCDRCGYWGKKMGEKWNNVPPSFHDSFANYINLSGRNPDYIDLCPSCSSVYKDFLEKYEKYGNELWAFFMTASDRFVGV